MRAAWEISREMFLSEPEVEVLLAHVRREHSAAADVRQRSAELDRLIIEMLLFTGLRTSEFCRLARADFNGSQTEASLTIRQGVSVDRIVYVPSSLAMLIEGYCRSTRTSFLARGIGPEDPLQPLVVHERGRPFERTGLYRRVVRILSDAGLGDRASVQLLRHTYGYLAYLRTGGNLLFTQRQLGHAHPIVTSIYAQFVPESYAKLAEMLVAGSTTHSVPAAQSKQPTRKKRAAGRLSPSQPPGAKT